MNFIWKYLRGDKVIWMVVMGLSVFSLLAIYSSTGTLAYKEQHGNTEYYVLRHFLLLLLGWAIMVVAHNIKYTYYSRISQLLFFIAVPLLIVVLFAGPEINDAKRWLVLPVINMTFQPSDLGKLALVMYVARILAKNQKRIKEIGPFWHIMIASGCVSGLIFFANLSTAVLVMTTAFVMMFIGRIRTRYLVSTALCAIGVMALFVLVVKLTPPDKFDDVGRLGTWANRIERFTGGGAEVGEDFQAEQAKIAVAGGGLFGKSPGNSTQRNILPHPYSDFIYAIVVEEYGFIGGFIIMLLYVTLFFRTVEIARKCEGTFGSFLSVGIGFLLVMQAMMNMAVSVGAMPVTGQVLPFLSMGGTSLWLTSLGIGIVLSVSVEVEKKGRAIDQIEKNPTMQSAEEIAADLGIDNKAQTPEL